MEVVGVLSGLLVRRLARFQLLGELGPLPALLLQLLGICLGRRIALLGELD